MVINKIIVELDMKHASLSIWLALGKIDMSTYGNMVNLPKKERVVKTGLMIKEDPDLYKTLQRGYDIYISKLLEKNCIPESAILERVHDAIWLLDYIPVETEFPPVKFEVKNVYDMCYKYKNLWFYLKSFTLELATRGVQHFDKPHPFLQKIEDCLKMYMNRQFDRCYTTLHKMRRNLEKDNNFYGPQIGAEIDINIKIVKDMIKNLI